MDCTFVLGSELRDGVNVIWRLGRKRTAEKDILLLYKPVLAAKNIDLVTKVFLGQTSKRVDDSGAWWLGCVAYDAKVGCETYLALTFLL